MLISLLIAAIIWLVIYAMWALFAFIIAWIIKITVVYLVAIVLGILAISAVAALVIKGIQKIVRKRKLKKPNKTCEQALKDEGDYRELLENTLDDIVKQREENEEM